MLFWEVLSTPQEDRRSQPANGNALTIRSRRLPYDKRCLAITRAGSRCRGRIRDGTEFCVFHDPRLTAERRQRLAARGGRKRHRLAHLPDGYLRKLKTRAAVGEAMDRLYREVRLGVISTEMGGVLFRILTRLLDSGLVQSGPCPERTKAARIRPKLHRLLTRQERAAWEKAVENASMPSPGTDSRLEPCAPFERAVAQRSAAQPPRESSVPRPLQAAS